MTTRRPPHYVGQAIPRRGTWVYSVSTAVDFCVAGRVVNLLLVFQL